MIKRILVYLLIFQIFLFNFFTAYAAPSLLSEAAILIDADTGTILAQKNADKKMYPASLTKIMTAILAIEMGKLTDVITVDNDCRKPHCFGSRRNTYIEGFIVCFDASFGK